MVGPGGLEPPTRRYERTRWGGGREPVSSCARTGVDRRGRSRPPTKSHQEADGISTLCLEVPERVLFGLKATFGDEMFPIGHIFLTFDPLHHKLAAREHGADMEDDESTVDRRASEAALAFGSMIRSRRKALDMRQDQLALATGVGRRFLIDLEAGKPSCQLGRSLLVAEALGLRSTDILVSRSRSGSMAARELPDLPDEVEEPDGWSTRIL